MTRTLARRLFAAFCLATALAAPGAAQAADRISDARQLTSGATYDRNGSVVVNGDEVWMFFTRSQAGCNRIAGGNCDNVDYDLWMRTSTDGGQTFGPATKIASNPGPAGIFRGRTVAATRTPDGTLHLFWASGGAGSSVYYYKKDRADPGFTQDATLTIPGPIMNVEAVGDTDNSVLVYTEEQAPTLAGVAVRRLNPAPVPAYEPPVAVPDGAGKVIPKVMRDTVDTQPFRMATSETDGSVHLATSAIGVEWALSNEVVPPASPVTNWDPNVVRGPDGRALLFYAPDLGNGVQRIEYRTSTAFGPWSDAEQVTTGVEGGEDHWDYWPEPAVIDGVLTLFFTSEREADTEAGVGHIYSVTFNAPEPPAGPTPVFDADGDGIVDGADCAPDDASRPAEDGADKDCNGEVDPVPQQQAPQQQAPQQTGGDGGSGTSTGGGTTATATIISLCGFGTGGADLIVCGAEPNSISGLGDDDRLFGGDGNDRINGGNGDDTIGGGGGADRLNGQNHADAIDGGPGNDRISGGSGDDAAIGGAGNDRITGGRGQDVVRSGSGKDVINVRDRRGGDVVSCGSGRDTVVYDRGDIVSRDCERRLRRR